MRADEHAGFIGPGGMRRSLLQGKISFARSGRKPVRIRREDQIRGCSVRKCQGGHERRRSWAKIRPVSRVYRGAMEDRGYSATGGLTEERRDVRGKVARNCEEPNTWELIYFVSGK